MSYDLMNEVLDSSNSSVTSTNVSEESITEIAPVEGNVTFAFGTLANYDGKVGEFYFCTDKRYFILNGNIFVPLGKGQIYEVLADDEELPTDASSIKLDKIYLKKPSSTATYYIEYLYVSGKWEVIGMSAGDPITDDMLTLNY